MPERQSPVAAPHEIAPSVAPTAPGDAAAGILRLQRAAGNDATIRRLTATGTRWEDVGRAKGSGVGASGGVLFVYDEDEEQDAVVLKGLKNAAHDPNAPAQHNPGKTLTSEVLLKQVGIETPDSRPMPRQSAEGAKALKAVDSLVPERKQGRFDERRKFLEESDTILVGRLLGGSTVQEMVDDDGKFADFCKAFADQGILREVGRMIAIDAFLGLKDRFTVTGGLNLGNLMVDISAMRVLAIDNDAKLDALGPKDITPTRMSMVETIAHGKVTATAKSIADATKRTIQMLTAGKKGELAGLGKYVDDNHPTLWDDFATGIVPGIKEGRQTLLDMALTAQDLGLDALPSSVDYDPSTLQKRQTYLSRRRWFGPKWTVKSM